MRDERCTWKIYFYSKPIECHRPAVVTFGPNLERWGHGSPDFRHRVCLEHAAEMRTTGMWTESKE